MFRTPAAVVALLVSLAAPVAHAGSWTGAGGNSNWSNGGNWNNGIPNAPGDTANFTLNSVPLAVFADIGVTVQSMNLFNFNWALSGQPITFAPAGYINVQFGSSPTISNDLVFAGITTLRIDSTLALGNVFGPGSLIKEGSGSLAIANFGATGSVTVNDGTLTVSPATSQNALTIGAGGTVSTGAGPPPSGFTRWASLSGDGTLVLTDYTLFDGTGTFSGALEGTGTLVKSGTGTLTLTGTAADWYAGMIIHPGNTLQLGAGAPWGLPALPFFIHNQGTLRVDLSQPGTLQLYGIETGGDVVVQSGQLYQAHSVSGDPPWDIANLTIESAGYVQQKTVNTSGTVTLNAGTWALDNGSIGGLAGTGNGNVLILAGTLNVGTNNADTVFPGFVTNGGLSTLRKVGSGKLTIGGTIVPTVDVAQGELHLLGQQVFGSVFVRSGATLSGGAAGFNGVLVEPGATFAPTSYVTQGALNSSGTLSFAIVSSVQNDVVVLGQAPGITGSTLVLTGSYVPVLGDSFTIVRNDSANPTTGTFAGLFEGALFTFNGVGLRISYVGGDGNDVVLSVATHDVTPSATGSGAIAPTGVQTVLHEATKVFTLTPGASSRVGSVTGSCGGTLGTPLPNQFTTAPVEADCTVIANFVPDTFIVTPIAGDHGAIAPNSPQVVVRNATPPFTVTPATGYTIDSVTSGPNCAGGGLVGNTYTTGPVTGDCVVSASFKAIQYTVTPNAGPNGNISPNFAQPVDYGNTTTFTVTPDAGYVARVLTNPGDCGGALAGSTYTTAAITASCNASVAFEALTKYNVVLEGWQQVPYVVTPGSGTVAATFNPVTSELTLDITYSGLSSGETMAHIHGPGARGVNAGVLIDLYPPTTSPRTKGVTLTPAQITQLQAGQLYVNVHTVNFAGGEIRGQLDNVGAVTRHTLTIQSSLGGGAGTVSGTTEAGTVINCPGDCSESIPAGKVVTLTAAATAGSTFRTWEGDCISFGTGTCTLTMGAAKVARARFDPASTPQSADMTASQNAPASGATGRDLVITVTATNNGPAAATNAAAGYLMPAGADYVWSSPGCANQSGTVLCAIGTLAASASASFKVVIRPTAAGTLASTAGSLADESDPDSSNNVAVTPVSVALSPPGTPIQRYRLYSDVTKEHHFTTDLNEYNVLGTYVGTWVQEGTVGKVLNNPGPFGGVEAVPYYRLYDNNTRWHHWTTDANEYYTLGFVYAGWNMEGVDGWILPTQVAGTTQLYRLNYPALGALHHWTIDANEYNTLITPAYGWVGEGGSGFVVQ